MNKTPALLALCGVLLLGGVMALVNGCQRSTDQPAQASQADAENAALRESLERTGKTMEELASQVERQQSREAEKAGEPPVVRDLAVARATLTEAQKLAAQAKDAPTTAVAVARLRRALQSLAAELPASLIIQHADRAVYMIKAAMSVGSKDFSDASLELVAAYDAANHGRPAELVPAVTNDLEGALKALKKGDAEGTVKTLNDVIGKALENAALKGLAQAQIEAAGAESALGRGAWTVLAAELAELEGMLSHIVTQQAATPKTDATPPATGQTAPATDATTAPAAGAPAPGQQPATATPPAAATTGQQPAAAQPPAAAPPAATPAAAPAGGAKAPAAAPPAS